jgi:hypothetical protein
VVNKGAAITMKTTTDALSPDRCAGINRARRDRVVGSDPPAGRRIPVTSTE